MGRRTRRVPTRNRQWVWFIVGGAIVVASVILVLRARTGGPNAAGEIAEFPHIHGLAVDPADPDILWVGSHGMLVKVTGRKRWMRVGRAGYDLMGFTVNPTQPGVLLTSGHPGPNDRRPNPLGVEVSRDAGQSWTPLSMVGQTDFHAMAISPADPQVIYAWNVTGRVGFYRSRDGGLTWTFLNGRQLGQVYALAAMPTNVDTVLAGTASGLLRSVDAGLSWQPVSPALSAATVTAVAIHRARPSVIYAYAPTPHLGLIRSLDGGQTWTPLGFFVGDRDAVGYLALHPKDPESLYLATYDSHLFWFAEGGTLRQQLARAGRVLR